MATPSRTEHRPITILGTGSRGRRIACVFVAGGYNVCMQDASQDALKDAVGFVDAHKEEYWDLLVRGRTEKGGISSRSNANANENTHFGIYKHSTTLSSTVRNAWLVIEALPDNLQLKSDILAEADTHAPADCVLSSSSATLKASAMVGKVSDKHRMRVFNIHFAMPPRVRCVEIMSAAGGSTAGTGGGEVGENILGDLEDLLRQCGMVPVRVKKESTGIILNRLWAAINREILHILSEGVSDALQIDLLWENLFKNGPGPCQLMDEMGLDTVARIEDSYIQDRRLNSTAIVDWLRREYIDTGRLGQKTEKGGLYPASKPGIDDGENPEEKEAGSSSVNSTSKDIYVVDVGLCKKASDISQVHSNGRILRLDAATGKLTPVIVDQHLPDGVHVSTTKKRIFWTNMGRSPAVCDGRVGSARMDGSDMRCLVEAGTVHTPKQLVADETRQMLYFTDREGASVHRCGFDGRHHEVLVQRRATAEGAVLADRQARWCVGVAIDVERGLLYWTQKGPSKGGRGSIFRAGLDIPAGQTAEDRSDIERLFDHLPEPIDMDLDTSTQTMYWTDRGEHPMGCSLNGAYVGGELNDMHRSILANHLHEPIGLKLDCENCTAYVADMGGCVYSIALTDGSKTVLVRDEGCYTGITLA